MQDTVKAAASSFYAIRSVFDAGRLRFQGFAAETQISNEIGGTDMRPTKFNMKDNIYLMYISMVSDATDSKI